MNSLPSIFRGCAVFAGVWVLASAVGAAQNAPQTPAGNRTSGAKSDAAELVRTGTALFRQDCSFCHGRDAAGGDSGPDLTRSHLVARDRNGDRIGPVIRNGRPDRGMPPFDLSEQQVAALVAFIHTQQQNADGNKGGRKGVDVADLETGNAAAGKRYFEGTGGCAKCHSATGDLAGVASRYQGLQLELQMLYPRHARSKVTVTLASGETVTGRLAYRDEFTIGLVDQSGTYRSWRTRDVNYKVDAPVEAHVEQFPRYTDDDIHNLMAYLETLR
jgi:cytochrome c oxidase cbb3-type subunit III